MVTKLPLALATKAKSQRAESALLCASVVAPLGSFFLSIFDSVAPAAGMLGGIAPPRGATLLLWWLGGHDVPTRAGRV